MFELWDHEVGVQLAERETEEEVKTIARQLIEHHGEGQEYQLTVFLPDQTAKTGAELRSWLWG